MGFGKTRFSSPRDKFRLLYLAQDPATAIAETIVRDRFQGKAERLILREEFDRYSIAVIRNPSPLFLLDLRYEGANLLGVSTDAVRARAQTSGRRLSQEIYDRTDFDGILYMSRITNKQCVAVYDRATASIEADGPAWDLIRLSALGPILDALHLTVIGGGNDVQSVRRTRGAVVLRHSAELDHRDKLGAGRKASGRAAKFATTKSTKARTFGES
ncbi:RES family NAD+ phosphorylase [Rhizobium ruizarguesonis]|uniref:RES family NAD+ phosphorylase n=1 Tax=Rhizobium ruizarguesonis TaxID=2081791 RepID=UPI001FE211E6|nr:RES family NAD+ phosphorylase [Rhizobium ruizarguesonis]